MTNVTKVKNIKITTFIEDDGGERVLFTVKGSDVIHNRRLFYDRVNKPYIRVSGKKLYIDKSKKKIIHR